MRFYTGGGLIHEANIIRARLIHDFPEYREILLPIQIRVSNRMTQTAGKAGFRRDGNSCIVPVVILSQPIFLRPENQYDFEETVLHEFAHHIAGIGKGHGPKWRAVAKRIGCTAERCHNLATAPRRRQARVSVVCNRCGKACTLGPRQAKKMHSYVHRDCGGNFRIP